MAYYMSDAAPGSSPTFEVSFDVTPDLTKNIGVHDTITVYGQVRWYSNIIRSMSIEFDTSMGAGVSTKSLTLATIDSMYVAAGQVGNFSMTFKLPQKYIDLAIEGGVEAVAGLIPAFIYFHAYSESSQTGWSTIVRKSEDIKFNVIVERNAPVISNMAASDLYGVVHDGNTPYQYFGGFVQNKSLPKFQIDFATDAQDSKLTATHKLTISGGDIPEPLEFAADTSPGETQIAFEIPAFVHAAENAQCVYTITDSVGMESSHTITFPIYAYASPRITGFNVQRYITELTAEGSEDILSDFGTHVWITLGGIATSIALKNSWTLKLLSGISGEDAREETTVNDGSDGTSFAYVNDKNIYSAKVEETITYEFTAVLSDLFETARMTVLVLKAGGFMDVEKTGVAIGMRSTSDEANKKFEVAKDYISHFYGGIEGVNIYRTGEVKTGGRWIDGRPIYRQLVNFGMVVNNGSVSVPLNTGPLASLVRIWGAGRRDQELRPIPLVGAALAFLTGVAVSGFDTDDPQVYIVAGSDGGFHEAWCILEYTKVADLPQTSLLMDASGAALVDSNGLMLAAAGSETYTLMHTGSQVDAAVTQAMEMYMAFANGELKGDPGLGIVNVTITEVV